MSSYQILLMIMTGSYCILTGKSLDEGVMTNSDIRIFSANNQITVVNKSDDKDLDLQVLNINGQMARDFGQISGEYNTVTFNNVPGIYVVRAIAGNRVITAKVFIR